MSRRTLFVVWCAVCLAGAAGYVAVTTWHRVTPAAAPQTAVTLPQETSTLEPAERIELLYRRTALGETYGTLVLAALDSTGRARYFPGLRCERVHFASGWGVCLTASRGVFTTYGAEVFDAGFERHHHLNLAGVPSRTRVSPDGRRAAITVFVSGHSYAAANFSTQTIIIDPSTGEILGDLEHYTIFKDGAPFRRPDFNFWGVTFTRNSDRFYATLRTAGMPHLIEGSISERQAQLLREGVECPALSPDNTRIAFKKRVGGAFPKWRLHVLEIGTGKETALAETRSADDQVEWFDDHQIMYALPEGTTRTSAVTNVWLTPADGSGAPRLLVEGAYSPVVIRAHNDLPK